MIVHFFREPIAQLLTAHNIFETKVFVTLQAQVFRKQIFENCVFFASVPFDRNTLLFANILQNINL